MAGRAKNLQNKEDKEFKQAEKEREKRQKPEMEQMNRKLKPFIARFLDLFKKLKPSFIEEMIEAIQSDRAYAKLSPEERKELLKNAEQEEIAEYERKKAELTHEGPVVVAEKKRILADESLTDKEKLAALAQLCDISGKFITVKFKNTDAILRFQPTPEHGVEIYTSPIEKSKNGKDYIAQLEVIGGVGLSKNHKIKAFNLDNVIKEIERYEGLDKDFNELNIQVLGYDPNPDGKLNKEDQNSLEDRENDDEAGKYENGETEPERKCDDIDKELMGDLEEAGGIKGYLNKYGTQLESAETDIRGLETALKDKVSDDPKEKELLKQQLQEAKEHKQETEQKIRNFLDRMEISKEIKEVKAIDEQEKTSEHIYYTFKSPYDEKEYTIELGRPDLFNSDKQNDGLECIAEALTKDIEDKFKKERENDGQGQGDSLENIINDATNKANGKNKNNNKNKNKRRERDKGKGRGGRDDNEPDKGNDR